jgi:ABC-type multidrug transport system fused ATPase/permease subunit
VRLPLPGLRRLLPMLRPYQKGYYWAFLGSLVEVVTNLFSPWMMKLVVDRIVITGETVQTLIPYLIRVVLFLLVLGIIRAVSIYFQIYLYETGAQGVARDLRTRLFEHMQRLPFAFHNATRTGDLMSRMTSDVNCIREAFGFGLSLVAIFIAYFLGVMSVLFYLNWRFALVASAVIPFILWAGIRFSQRSEPMFDKIQDEIAKLTAMIQENISGVRVVRAFHRERSEVRRFCRQNSVLYGKNMEIAKLQTIYFPLMDFLTCLTTALVLLYGGGRAIVGEVSIGLLVAFNGYLMILIWPVRLMGFALSLLQKGEAASERVHQLLSEPEFEDKGITSITDVRIRGKIDFEDVHFVYPDSDLPALEEINLHVPPGQVVALLGTTGSGKSTLVQLIPRFFDVTSGVIRLDGVDLRDIPLADLRRQIALVFQENFLFSTTIRENIGFGRKDANIDQIVAAAKAAQADGFIRNLPQGYETVVGERGVGLSGGQRQRIAIARAILCNPPILLLDDSTSSVDQETEREIQKALDNLMKGRTTFIIAQRLTSVMKADQILVMDKGLIVESGRHEELLSQGGLYKRLYDLQWGNEKGSETVEKLA